MRRTLGNLALEQEELEAREAAELAAQEEQERAALESISLEEETLLISEASEAAASTAKDLAESNRILDVSDALEDLAVVAGKIKEATPSELSLIENASQMAVAGTDVEPEELVPALEAFEGKVINVENLKKTAKQIWERIMAFIKKIWEKIVDFFDKTFSLVPVMQKRLRELKSAVDGIEGKKLSSDKLTLSLGAASLAVDGKVVGNAQELSDAYTRLTDSVDWAYNQYVDSAVARGQVVVKHISELTFENATEKAQDLAKDLGKVLLSEVARAGSASKARFPGFVSKAGPELLGNIQLVSKYFEGGDKEGVFDALDRQRKSAVVTQSFEGEMSRTYEFATPTPDGVRQVIEQAEKLLGVLDDYRRSAKRAALLKTKKDLERASNKASSAIKFDNDPTARFQAYRDILEFNHAFAGWARDPAVTLMTSSLSTVRATIALMGKVMASYKAAGAEPAADKSNKADKGAKPEKA